MYQFRRVGLILVGVALTVSPLLTAWMPLSQERISPTKIYPGNQDFLHETGTHHPYGWEAYFRVHRPGYMARHLRDGGQRLAEGAYRYQFVFALRPGHLTSLLSGANNLIRLEVADLTTQEILIERTFQLADFKRAKKGLITKGLTFSTNDREGHYFEPRIYWYGMAGLFLQRVELVPLGNSSWDALAKKAEQFEQMMPENYLENGFVVVRDSGGMYEDLGDSAIWTGLYAASEAFRYEATQDKTALKRMEDSLWALHRLVQGARIPGTMVRYVDSSGKAILQSPSKDTYTGFFYGVSRGLPYVRTPALRDALLKDLQALAGHFLDHDLVFASPDGFSVDMNPYLSKGFITETISDIRRDPGLRREILQVIRIVRWYFWIHGQRPPPSFARFMKMLKKPETAPFEQELLPLINDFRKALRGVQKNVHKSALRGARQGLSDTPYMKLDVLLLRALKNLDVNSNGQMFNAIEDLKILPSQSLHALHFLKVAGEALPKPNRYDKYYRDNLYEGKALLRTAIQWHQIDEDALVAIRGQTEANTRRTSSSHISYLALHNLILLEKDPIIRFKYQKLFEVQYLPMRTDGNAMIDAMHAAVGLSTQQLGLALWSLGRYPLERLGKGEAYWQANRRDILEAFGGEINGQAGDALPPDLRPRDAFLWQRSAHSIRGDHQGWMYPPLDYLFAYWLARHAATVPRQQPTHIEP